MRRTKSSETDLSLIWSSARTFHKSSGLDLLELVGEASVAYAEAMNTYDPDFGTKFTSWAFRVIRHHLSSYLLKERKHRQRNVQWNPPTLEDGKDPFETLIRSSSDLRKDISFKDALLSREDLKIVYEIIRESPHEFLSMRKELRMKMIGGKLLEMGWTWNRVQKAFKEIKELLKR